MSADSAFSRATMETAGFTGFVPVKSLATPAQRRAIPNSAGVYVLMRPPSRQAAFRPSSAGWFKGKDPTVPMSALTNRWVPNASIVYSGKSGKGPRSDLRKRVAALIRFRRWSCGWPFRRSGDMAPLGCTQSHRRVARDDGPVGRRGRLARPISRAVRTIAIRERPRASIEDGKPAHE